MASHTVHHYDMRDMSYSQASPGRACVAACMLAFVYCLHVVRTQHGQHCMPEMNSGSKALPCPSSSNAAWQSRRKLARLAAVPASPGCPNVHCQLPPPPPALPTSGLQVSKEVLGARDTLVGCGIPLSELRGFRTPFLSDSPTIREVLYDNGFRCVPHRKLARLLGAPFELAAGPPL